MVDAVSNIAYFPQYTNQLMYQDLTGLNPGYCLDFDSSVFGSNYMTPMSPVMPYGNYNNQDYGQYLDQMYNNQNLQLQQQREYSMFSQSPQLLIETRAKTLARAISEKDTDEIQEALNEYVACVNKTYNSSGKASEEEVRIYAGRLFSQMYGTDLGDALKENGKSSFWAGLTFSKSGEDLAAQIEGRKPNSGSTASKICGNIVGVLTLGLAGLLLFRGGKSMLKLAKP